MGNTEPSATFNKVIAPSDEELIRQICPLSENVRNLKARLKNLARIPESESSAELQLLEQQHKQAVVERNMPGNELFTRHHGVVEGALTRLIDIGGLCPARWTAAEFHGHCLSHVYDNMLARICGFAFLGSFDGWLKMVTKTTALDEYDKLLRDDLVYETDINITGKYEASGERPRQDVLDILSTQTDYLPEHEWMKGQPPKPDSIVVNEMEKVEEERRQRLARLTRELWETYQGQSHANAESVSFIRLHRQERWPHSRIAALKYGQPTTDKEQKQHIDRVAQKICRNSKGIKELCKRTYARDLNRFDSAE